MSLKSGKDEKMPIEEFARWMCLLEAFDFIEQKAAQLKVDVEDMIKPLAIEAYINERHPAMLADVKAEIKMGIL